MEPIGRFLLLSGFILILSAYLWIVIAAFKNRFILGLLCLLVPFYVYYYGVIRKGTRHKNAISVFLAGFAILIVGMVVVS